jgi:hypothetical protein
MIFLKIIIIIIIVLLVFVVDLNYKSLFVVSKLI